MPNIYDLGSDSFEMKASETTMTINRVAALDTATAGQCKRPAATTADVLAGVLREASLAEGEIGKFQTDGRAKVEVYAAVSIGDRLVVADETGRVRKAVNPTDAGLPIVGIALTAATTQGSTVYCRLTLGTLLHS